MKKNKSKNTKCTAERERKSGIKKRTAQISSTYIKNVKIQIRMNAKSHTHTHTNGNRRDAWMKT